jgi:hypothetical protein
MKISKNFRLSEEAVEVLNSQHNATQYIEKLILADEAPVPVTEGRVSYLLTQQTEEIITALKNNRLATPISYSESSDMTQQQMNDLANLKMDLAKLQSTPTGPNKFYSDFEESA